MLVKPAPGLKVRDPQSKQHIPETGIEVSETDSYWARRLLDGDVVEVKPVTAAKSPKGKE
jgi:hypothetical protein